MKKLTIILLNLLLCVLVIGLAGSAYMFDRLVPPQLPDMDKYLAWLLLLIGIVLIL